MFKKMLLLIVLASGCYAQYIETFFTMADSGVPGEIRWAGPIGVVDFRDMCREDVLALKTLKFPLNLVYQKGFYDSTVYSDSITTDSLVFHLSYLSSIAMNRLYIKKQDGTIIWERDTFPKDTSEIHFFCNVDENTLYYLDSTLNIKMDLKTVPGSALIMSTGEITLHNDDTLIMGVDSIYYAMYVISATNTKPVPYQKVPTVSKPQLLISGSNKTEDLDMFGITGRKLRGRLSPGLYITRVPSRSAEKTAK